jgi:hypothetical protein
MSEPEAKNQSLLSQTRDCSGNMNFTLARVGTAFSGQLRILKNITQAAELSPRM